MTQESDIQHEEEGSKGRYWTQVDGHTAEMTYSRANEHLIIIDHTGVPDALRGKGVGVRLVELAVREAMASGTKIMPLCPFAKAQIQKRPEWQSVLS